MTGELLRMPNKCSVFEDELTYGKVNVDIHGHTYTNVYPSLRDAAKAAAILELISGQITVLLSFQGANYPKRHVEDVRSDYDVARLVAAGFKDVTLN